MSVCMFKFIMFSPRVSRHGRSFKQPILDRSKDTKKPIQDLMGKLRQYPLYRMIHIAIACDRLDLFTNENIQLMNTKYKPFER